MDKNCWCTFSALLKCMAFENAGNSMIGHGSLSGYISYLTLRLRKRIRFFAVIIGFKWEYSFAVDRVGTR